MQQSKTRPLHPLWPRKPLIAILIIISIIIKHVHTAIASALEVWVQTIFESKACKPCSYVRIFMFPYGPDILLKELMLLYVQKIWTITERKQNSSGQPRRCTLFLIRPRARPRICVWKIFCLFKSVCGKIRVWYLGPEKYVSGNFVRHFNPLLDHFHIYSQFFKTNMEPHSRPSRQHHCNPETHYET